MPQMWVRNAVAEGIGAFALTFVALMTFTTGDITPYAVGQGLTILVLVAALGHVSGGHFNPAVTLAFLLGKRIDVVGASIYWAAQLIGGILAALTVLLTLSRDVVAAGVPVPGTEGDLNIFGAVVIEAIAVFVVVLVVLGTILDQRAPLSVYPFAIGLAYAAGIFAIGGFTGGALNPARAFGPAVVGGEWEGIASWLIGPLVGAVLAWLLFEFVLTRPVEDEALAGESDEADTVAVPVSESPAETTRSRTTRPDAFARPVQDSQPARPAVDEPATMPTDEAAAVDEAADERVDGPVDERVDGPVDEPAAVDDPAAEPGQKPESTPRGPQGQPPPPPPASKDLPSSHKGLLDQ